MTSKLTIFFTISAFAAMVLSLSSCANMLQMEERYHWNAAQSACPEKLNCSPYKAHGLREDCVEQKTGQKKEAFSKDALTEYSQEGKTNAETGFGGGKIPSRGWWCEDLHCRLLRDSKTANLTMDEVYKIALAHSTQIKVFGNIPLIRETGIDEARGAFDTEFFSTMQYGRTHEPIGSTLTAGGNNRFFTEKAWDWESGVRKRLRTGAQVTLSQGTSRTTNNSQFFIPNDQGEAEIKLKLTQPILRGAGFRYNESVIRIAKLDHEIGMQEFIRQLETHLTEVNRSYWALYLARAMYLEKAKIVIQTEKIVSQLRQRGNLDTMASQNARAEAALASRQAELVRSELAIKNAESRLRALINDPSLIKRGIGELIPVENPVSAPVCVDFDEAVKIAVAIRPEILQAEGNLQASHIRERMAKQDRLPELNLFGETSVSDLEGRGNWEGALRDEFTDDDANWMVGATVSHTLERRFTRARHLRSELEFRQQKQRLKSTLETVHLEVLVAHREVTTAFPDMSAKYKAAEAARKDLEVQERRRSVDGDGGDGLTSIYLENLIEAQSRLLQAREEFLQSLVIYNVALTNMERAKGTLIRGEGFQFKKGIDCEGLPELRVVADGKDCAKNCIVATPVKARGIVARPVHY
jgi:outer membrane protein TolC